MTSSGVAFTPMTRASMESVASVESHEKESNGQVASGSSHVRASVASLSSVSRGSTQSSSPSPTSNARETRRGRPRRGRTERRGAGTKRRLSQDLFRAISQTLEEVDSEDDSTDDDFLVSGIRRSGPSEYHAREKQMISQSYVFKTTTGMIIMLNTIVIALEAVYVQQQLHIFDVLETTFTIFYTVEIAWRVWEKGIIDFLSKDDFWWNWFDLLITGLSLTDTFMDAFTESSHSGAAVTRLFRVFRILRMFRAMRFLNEVDYVLAHAAAATIKLSAVVSIVLFVSAIIATNMLWDCQDPIVANMFRDLGMSMWSMFKLMTLDDWIPVSERVIKYKPGMLVFFVVYIFCTSIALVSLVPAIFIEISMNSRNRQEKLDGEKQKLQQRRQKMRLLRTLFKLTDRNANGRISVSELKHVLQDDTYFRRLQEAGLTEPSDLRDIRLGLFDLWEETMDESLYKEAEITEEDFTNGILKVHENVSQAVLWRCSTSTRLMLRDFSAVVQKELRDIRENTSKLGNKIAILMDSLKDDGLPADIDRRLARMSTMENISTMSSATVMGGHLNKMDLKSCDFKSVDLTSDVAIGDKPRKAHPRWSCESETAAQGIRFSSMYSVPEGSDLYFDRQQSTSSSRFDHQLSTKSTSSWYPEQLVTTPRVGFDEDVEYGYSEILDTSKEDYIPPDVVGSGMMFEQYDGSEPLLDKAKVIPFDGNSHISPSEGAPRPASRDASLSPRERYLL